MCCGDDEYEDIRTYFTIYLNKIGYTSGMELRGMVSENGLKSSNS